MQHHNYQSGAEGIGAVGKMVMGGQQAQKDSHSRQRNMQAGNQRQYANSLQDLVRSRIVYGYKQESPISRQAQWHHN